MDIKVTVKYSNREEKKQIETIKDILSVDQVNEKLKKKFYNASSIEWHEVDDTLEDY